MAERRRIVVVIAAALTMALAVAGCGVSTSGPVDLGDGLVVGGHGNGGSVPPGPDSVSEPEDLVSAYLTAGVESGQTQPLDRLMDFLNEKAQKALRSKVDPQNPPNPTVIRLVGEPVKAQFTLQRTPVDVAYQVLGELNERGRVDELLADPKIRTMRFWVSPDDTDAKNNRIDEIENAPASVMITDKALITYYQVQPVYFWDAQTNELIPDLRYLPIGLGADQRASRIVKCLIDGGAGWLPAAQRLPAEATLKTPVTIRDDTIVVNFSSQAAVNGDAAVQRLYRQLQWSLQGSSAASKLELDIEGKPVDPKVIGSPNDFVQYNQAASLSSRGQRYDIVAGKVVSIPATGIQPAVLAAKENASVLYAAVNRNASLAILVRSSSDNRRSVQVARDGAPTRTVNLPPSVPNTKGAEVGRPAWIDGDHALLTVAGRLLALNASGGGAVDVTPNRFPRVQSVSISPDGKRIAMVADGQAYVASLGVTDDGIVTVGTNTRWLLGGQVTAAAVAWSSQGWVYVAGTSVQTGAAVLDRATADGVVAINDSKSLAEVRPSDVVAYPTAQIDGTAEVYLLDGQKTYLFRSQQVTGDNNLKNPFFGF